MHYAQNPIPRHPPTRLLPQGLEAEKKLKDGKGGIQGLLQALSQEDDQGGEASPPDKKAKVAVITAAGMMQRLLLRRNRHCKYMADAARTPSHTTHYSMLSLTMFRFMGAEPMGFLAVGNVGCWM